MAKVAMIGEQSGSWQQRSRALARLFGRSTESAALAHDEGVPWYVKDLWRRFGEAAGSHHIPERFDHHAAQLYMLARDPELLPEQRLLIQRLIFRRKQQISTPLVSSWEEQDPNFGRWVLGTLCFGEYGEFKIANNNHPRLNNPPISVPPPHVEVHLCVGSDWVTAVNCSAVNGFTALLLDDWRVALRPLDVSFHLHRLSPRLLNVGAFRPGRRWRDLNVKSLPPARATGGLFLRPNYADLATDGNWSVGPTACDRRSWWCVCLLENDLRSLGFSPTASSGVTGQRSRSWFAAVSRLPSQVDHVVVVPPEPAPGALLRVRRMSDGVELEPVRTRQRDLPENDYLRLRVVALDLLLDELWTRTGR